MKVTLASLIPGSQYPTTVTESSTSSAGSRQPIDAVHKQTQALNFNQKHTKGGLSHYSLAR